MVFLSSSQRVVSICVSCFRFVFFGGAPFKKPNKKYFKNIFLGRGSGHFLVIFFREGQVFFCFRWTFSKGIYWPRGVNKVVSEQLVKNVIDWCNFMNIFDEFSIVQFHDFLKALVL